MLWEINKGVTSPSLKSVRFSLTPDIRRNILHKFIEPSMEQPYWCTFVVHQHAK